MTAMRGFDQRHMRVGPQRVTRRGQHLDERIIERSTTLTAMQAEAAASNLDLQVALARIEESRAQLGLLDAARRPQLSGGAGYTRSGAQWANI